MVVVVPLGRYSSMMSAAGDDSRIQMNRHTTNFSAGAPEFLFTIAQNLSRTTLPVQPS